MQLVDYRERRKTDTPTEPILKAQALHKQEECWSREERRRRDLFDNCPEVSVCVVVRFWNHSRTE